MKALGEAWVIYKKYVKNTHYWEKDLPAYLLTILYMFKRIGWNFTTELLD